MPVVLFPSASLGRDGLSELRLDEMHVLFNLAGPRRRRLDRAHGPPQPAAQLPQRVDGLRAEFEGGSQGGLGERGLSLFQGGHHHLVDLRHPARSGKREGPLLLLLPGGLVLAGCRLGLAMPFAGAGQPVLALLPGLPSPARGRPGLLRLALGFVELGDGPECIRVTEIGESWTSACQGRGGRRSRRSPPGGFYGRTESVGRL